MDRAEKPVGRPHRLIELPCRADPLVRGRPAGRPLRDRIGLIWLGEERGPPMSYHCGAGWQPAWGRLATCGRLLNRPRRTLFSLLGSIAEPQSGSGRFGRTVSKHLRLTAGNEWVAIFARFDRRMLASRPRPFVDSHFLLLIARSRRPIIPRPCDPCSPCSFSLSPLWRKAISPP